MTPPLPPSVLEGVDRPTWRDDLPCRTIQTLLAERAHSDCPVIFLDEQGRPDAHTWGQVARRSFRVAEHLRAQGMAPGDRVVLMLPTGPGYLHAFFGAIALGAIPVPVYPPLSPKQLKAFSRTLAGILVDSGATTLVYWKDVKDVLGPALAAAPGVRHTLDVDAFPAGEAEAPPMDAWPEDTAFIQYTSGSTAQPKGVELSHDNLIHNVDGITHALGLVHGRDKVVSWLPLYHDMGLIGAMLGALYSHIDLILMAPTTFLKRPKLWLEAIQRYGATITVAPNFAYSLCAARLNDAAIAQLDLSTLRVAMCGAEPIRLETYQAFMGRFGACGFGADVFLPVYGLAESTVASTFPSVRRPPDVMWVDREALEADGEARPAYRDCHRAMPAFGLGRPFAGSRLRVVDPDHGEVVPEGRVGEIQLQGPSVMKGYFQQPDRTAETVPDGWLATGDLGFVKDGHLYVTGRKKDLIIRHGRNYYPQDLEAVVESHEGIRKGCVIAFGQAGTELRGEVVVVLAETRLTPPARREALARSIEDDLFARVGFRPDRLELLPPHTLLKTSSGKLRRKPTQAAYMAGELRPRQDSWLDTVGIVAQSRLHWGKRLLTQWARG